MVSTEDEATVIQPGVTGVVCREMGVFLSLLDLNLLLFQLAIVKSKVSVEVVTGSHNDTRVVRCK